MIGTTNKVENIDAALTRNGRLDHIYHVGIPTLEGRRQIWTIHLHELIKLNLVDVTIINELANITVGYTGAMIASTIR